MSSLTTNSKFFTTSMVKRMAPVFMRGSVLYLPPNRIPRMHNFSAIGGSASGGEFKTLNDFDFIEPLNL